jgi:glucose/arabinose dehydrogenase
LSVVRPLLHRPAGLPASGRRAGAGACAIVLAATLAAAGLTASASGAGAGKVPARPVVAARIGTFAFPVHVTAPPGDVRRLFVVEKAGTIRVVRDGKQLDEPFLDLRGEVRRGNEPGLFSLAFRPDYARSGRLYVYFAGEDRRTHLVEFRRSAESPDRADPGTRREVLALDHPSGEHFGGLLLFGPDRRLYLSTGDGGLNEWQDKLRAQRLASPHGKILRVSTATGAVEVIARGLRNPWRFAIDEATGDLYVGDAGEFVRESIEYAPRAALPGANFGWPCYEGGLAHARYPPEECPGARPPLLEYAREGGNCSAIGGVVVRDRRLPRLAGRFLYADFCLGEVRIVGVERGKAAARGSLRLYLPGITSFGTDAAGRVYVATSRGPVYRLDPQPASGRRARGTPPRRSGRELFLASGCGTCHVLGAAGTVGTYGPDLDESRPSRALVVARVTWGRGAMPYFKGRLSAAEIGRVADFVARST